MNIGMGCFYVIAALFAIGIGAVILSLTIGLFPYSLILLVLVIPLLVNRV